MKRLLQELRRRKVFRVAAAYAVVTWLLIQVADVTFEPMGLPTWSLRLVITLLVLGFPLACVLAWAYDVTPRGIERAPSDGEELDRPESDDPEQTVTAGHGASAQSVAILPFVNMSPDPDQDYFCDGIAEEIINALCCVRGLQVASRTSSFRFKGQAEDAREIGRLLGVGSVLEGSVRKVGDRVRINAQLLSADDGYNLWSQSYDRTLDDVFAIQTDIAKQLVEALQVTLRPGEDKLLGRGGTNDAQAYDYFLRGQQQLRAHGDGLEAAKMFHRALALDDGFAQAYAGLASALAMQAFNQIITSAEEYEAAFAASRRALELEPYMPEAYQARAQLYSIQGRANEAERDFEKAIKLNPSSYFLYYVFGRHCLGTGQLERAVDLFRAGARLAPEEYTPHGMLSFALQKLGRSEEERQARIEALRLLDGHLERNPDDDAAMGRGAILAAWLGQKSQALEFVDRVVQTQPDGVVGLYNAAGACAILGERDRALELLERTAQDGHVPLAWLEGDEDFASLRGDPRFTAILGRIRAASVQPTA